MFMSTAFLDAHPFGLSESEEQRQLFGEHSKNGSLLVSNKTLTLRSATDVSTVNNVNPSY